VNNRRHFLTSAVGGLGLAGLPGLLAADDPFTPKKPHFPAKAKNLIFLYMEGAPSQIDLLDPKPALTKWHGQSLPPSMTKDFKFAFIKPNAKVLGCRRPFAKYGQSGAEFSDWISAWKPIADEMCIVRSMRTDAFNHQPADLILFTGHMLPGRPTLGAWVTYGLGSMTENLPSFVNMGPRYFDVRDGHYLGPAYDAVNLKVDPKNPLTFARPEFSTTEGEQQAQFEMIHRLNSLVSEQYPGDKILAARMKSYQLAFNMQAAVPETMNLDTESAETKKLYGMDNAVTEPFARQLIVARRLAALGAEMDLERLAAEESFRDSLASDLVLQDIPLELN
jgi:hypothetical protein